MRLRHIPGAEQMIEDSPYVIQNPEERKGKWHEVFGNHNPIRIEVGMGKGRFIMELAKANPEINYIGIERYSTVPVSYTHLDVYKRQVFSFPINGRFIIWAAGRSHRGWITSSKPKTLPNRKPNTAEKNPQQEITAARSIFLTR